MLKLLSLCSLIVISLLDGSVADILQSRHRSKRFLTFPPTTPTRVQIIAGIGIPVDLNLESVTLGYVFKAEFWLPENASDYLSFLNSPFDVTTFTPLSPGSRRKRALELDSSIDSAQQPIDSDHQHFDSNDSERRGFDEEQNENFEQHDGKIEVESGKIVDPEQDKWDAEKAWFADDEFDRTRSPVFLKRPQNYATSRWTIYKGFAALAESKGLAGRPCVLRSICESAHSPFDYSNGILGELIHIVMTPSLTNDKITDHSDLEYLHAEKLGREGAPCDRIFDECKSSVLDQFSGIYTPMMDLFSRIIS